MNVLAQAVATDDLDAACLLVQTALGITDGGVASVSFSELSDYGPRSWAALDLDARARLLGEWLRVECLFADYAEATP
jgi:hypothetical protein